LEKLCKKELKVIRTPSYSVGRCSSLIPLKFCIFLPAEQKNTQNKSYLALPLLGVQGGVGNGKENTFQNVWKQKGEWQMSAILYVHT
jgi:hypothetical protein